MPTRLFLCDLSQAATFNPGPTPAKATLGTDGHALINVRIHDGGNITVPMHISSAVANRDGTLEPDNLPPTMVKVGWFGGTAIADGNVFAEPPHRRRDLPNNLLATDRTCTITVRAVNGGISPAAALKVWPVDSVQGAVTGFRDHKLTATVDPTDLVSIVYTVLK